MLPVLLHRHPGYAHDWQLHSLQFPPVHTWFLLDWSETYYYLVHQHDPEDWIRVVVIDSYVLFSLCHHPPRFDFENWHVFKCLVYTFIYGIFPVISDLVLTFISSIIALIPYHLSLTSHIGPCSHNIICSFPVPF